jgi:hypothetical protein
MEILTVISLIFCGLLALFKYIFDKFRQTFPADFDQIFENLEQRSAEDILEFRIFHKKIIFLNKPELIHKVLTSEACLEKPNMFYKFICADKGLVVEKGKEKV